MAISTYISRITLNANGVNGSIKGHKVAKWIKGSKTHIYATYKGLISNLKDIHRLKVRERKKVFMQIEMKRKLGCQYLPQAK